jgi:uncharacterized protein YndB with AHSA1/START domain
MSQPALRPVVHRTLTVERTYAASPTRVFAAWVDPEIKARWFVGPADQWKVLRRELDLRVGGQELLVGQLVGSATETRYEARYHVIVPDRRLVYVYDMQHGGGHLSTSLATVDFERTAKGGTRMVLTEQAAFMDGEDGAAGRQQGIAAHFELMAPLVEDATEIVSSRVLAAPRARVYEAFSDSAQLARWWGPKGFRNTFHEFDLRAGGVWRFTMHGPDGTDYDNLKEFLEVVPGERIVSTHGSEAHRFRMSMCYVDLGAETLLTWRMSFATAEHAAKIRARVEEANEENFDRLAAVLEASAR